MRAPFAALVMLSVCITSMPAAAQAPRLTRADASIRVTRLGTSDALYRGLGSLDDVRRMAADRAVQRRLAMVMDDAGLTGLTAPVLAAVSAADTQRMTEVTIAPGTRLQWMAFRHGAGARIQRPAVWAGREAFAAWQFTVDQGATRYTFLLPRACANLALLSDEPVPVAPTVDPDAERRAREERERAERDRLDRERAERERLERERAEAERAKADEARRASEAEAARLEAERQAEQQRLEDARLARERIDWFVAGAFGKERRVRETVVERPDGPVTIEAGECAPLFGVKAGVDIRLSPSWRLAPAIGVAFNTDEGDDSSLFADLELNRHGARGYVGTGIGVWDVTHSDTVAASWLLHGGWEVHRQQNDNRLFLAVEGRLFLNQLDDLENNYQFWGGLRYVVR